MPSPATLSHVATVSDKNFSKVRVGVKLASAKSTTAHAGSVDMKNSPSSPRGNKALSRSNGPMMQSVELKSSADLKKEEELLLQQLTKTLPDEPEVRDKLRELECEYPPLKYKVICSSEQMYSLCVHGFLRDIANAHVVHAVLDTPIDYRSLMVSHHIDNLTGAICFSC